MAKKIIKARLKQRTDTQANWAANNPVLLEGELGLVTDDKNLYKVGDGVTAWNDLPFRGFDGTLVHETGDSDNAAMSQRGVTRALAKLEERMVEKVPGKGLSTEDYTTEEKEKLAELSEEINGNLIQEINLTQGVGLNPNSKKFPLRISKGDIFIRLIDDNNILSTSEVTFFAYDAEGTAILSNSSVTKNGVTRRTLNADAESFGIFISSSAVVSTGKIDIEIISKASNYGVRTEIKNLHTITILPEFNGFVYSKIDGGLLSLSTSAGYTSRYFDIKDVISIYYKGSTYGNIGAIIFYDENKKFISAITGTTAVGTLIEEFPNTAKYARFSFVPNAEVRLTYRTDSAYNRLAMIEDSLKETSIKSIPLEVGIDASYIAYQTGAIVSASTMAISQEIDVKGGDVITIGAASTANAAAITIKKGGKYFPILRGNTSVLQDTYTMSEDCKIVVSFVKSTLTTNSIQILSNARISEIYEHLEKDGEIQERDNDFVAFPNGKQWRCVVDFTITENVNKTGADIVIAEFDKAPIVTINRANPSALFTRYADNEPSYVAELQYNSGYTIADKKYVLGQKKYKSLVGSPAISIWLKGLTSSTEPSESEILERASWLENHQDYAILFENNVFSIVRDGIAYNGSSFNGGSTETLFSTSIVGKTMASFYNELKALDYLEVEMMNMTPSASCEELLQFGKVKLVGRYYQQKSRTSNAKEYLYDSFPFLLRYAKDNKSHVLEMVNDGNNTYIALDGLFAKVTTLPEVISIQKSSSISINNVSWESGDIDGVILHDDYLISDKTSRIIGFMGHSVKNTYEGSGLITDEVTASVTRLENICSLLKEENYKVLNLDDINNIMSRNMSQLPSMRNAFFIFDDERIKEVYLNYEIRNHVARYGYPMNFAVIHDRSEFTQAEKASVLPMRLNGWCCASHSLLHDVALPNKNSVILRWELSEIKRRCDSNYFIPNVLVYNWSGDWEPLYNMLNLCGYVAAINSSGDYTIKASNPYNMGRINIADIVPFSNIKKLVV